MPDSCAYPTVAGVPDSGVGMTRSAFDRVLPGQRAAHLDLGLVHDAAVDRRVGACQVDVFPKTQPLGVGSAKRCERSPSSSTMIISPGSTSRT